jgi:hypothetical protein
MGRELRKVPKGWEHPKRDDGTYQPMFDESFKEAAQEWKDGFEEWKENPEHNCEYWEWDGDPPNREYYMPDWTDKIRTHYQMYETTSEGTPISPVFDNIEDLAHWLADNNATTFAYDTASYEWWLYKCKLDLGITKAVNREGRDE